MSSEYTPPNLVKPAPGGNPGDGTMAGTLTVYEKADVAPNQNYVVAGANRYVLIGSDSSGNLVIGVGWPGNVVVGPSFQIVNTLTFATSNSFITTYKGINTVGFGVAPLFGKDVRTGLTAADSAATTLYTTTAAGQVYEVTARILGTGGTITSGVYTIGWTEGGVARTASVSVTATGTLASAVFLLQPDSGTAITAQLTTLSGTSPVANVAAVLKQLV